MSDRGSSSKTRRDLAPGSLSCSSAAEKIAFQCFPGRVSCALASAKFEIDPDDPGDYQRLLSAISAQGKFPRSFVHLWSVCDPGAGEDLPDDVDAAETKSFYSLLVLGQALGALDLEGSIEIAVVSNRLHQVADEPVLRPARALLAGPCGVIPKELTNVRCRNIDLDDLGTDTAGKLVAELQSRSIESPVAYRKNGRWVQTFVSLAKPGNRNPSLFGSTAYI